MLIFKFEIDCLFPVLGEKGRNRERRHTQRHAPYHCFSLPITRWVNSVFLFFHLELVFPRWRNTSYCCCNYSFLFFWTRRYVGSVAGGDGVIGRRNRRSIVFCSSHVNIDIILVKILTRIEGVPKMSLFVPAVWFPKWSRKKMRFGAVFGTSILLNERFKTWNSIWNFIRFSVFED